MADAGTDAGYESDDRPGRIQRLGELLREARGRLESYQELDHPSPAQRDAWDADLYFYDDALVSVADLLDVEIPPGARDDLTPEDRAEIEAAVTAAGLDLNPSRP
ncbi:MAG TPA: hypothetical protein VNT56_09815 [Acidimicrobiales bacterium]|nr:hypothetical protein [Acidimicrobiales bacterium]